MNVAVCRKKSGKCPPFHLGFWYGKAGGKGLKSFIIRRWYDERCVDVC